MGGRDVEHYPVVFFAGPDVAGFDALSDRVTKAVNPCLAGHGTVRGRAERRIAIDRQRIDDLPPSVSADRLSEDREAMIREAAAVVLVLQNGFDEPTRMVCDQVVDYHQTNKRPTVLLYRLKAVADDDDDEVLAQQQLRNKFLKRLPKTTPFDDADALERKLVLDLVAEAPKFPHAPPIKTIPLRGYLDFLAREFAFLKIPGLAGKSARHFPLDQVYVRIRMRSGAVSSDRGTGKDRGLAADRLDVELNRVLPRERPLAVIGDPGAGKTTLLKYVALGLARVGLGASEGADRFGFEEPAPTPVYFKLTDVVDRLRQGGWREGLGVDLERWGRVLEHTLSFGGITAAIPGHKLLRQGGLLLLFDGLDEVAGAETRQALSQAIGTLANMDVDGPRNRVVMACRTRAFGRDAAFGAFEAAELQPLDEPAIRDFARKWTAAAGALHGTEGTAGAAPIDAGELEEAVAGNRMIRRIATNPQMLTMLAALYTAQRKLPPQRALLYKECVDWLLYRHPTALEPFGGPVGARRALTALARRLQAAVDDQGRPRNALESFETISALCEQLGCGDDRDRGEEFLRALELSVGIIVADRAEVRFHHRTFQEYLVARDLADHDDPVAALGSRADDPQWLEVVALTAGVLADQGEGRLKVFLAALVPQSGSLADKAPRVGVIAQCLEDLSAWSLADHVLAPAQAALDEVLPIFDDPAQPVDEDTRVAIALGLGRTKDPRLIQDQRWVEVPAGRAWRGAAPGDDAAYDDEKPAGWVEVSRFWIQRWAVTVGEYAEFLEEGAHEERWWSPAGWAWRTEGKAAAPEGREKQTALNLPVVGVSWWEAEAYCAWMSRQPHFTRGVPRNAVVRLPTEAEWEKAARARPGDPGPATKYPWGDEFEAHRCNSGDRRSGAVPVGCYRAGHSGLGLWDMTGNVDEWCRDAVDRLGPYQKAEADPESSPGADRVIRGGAWDSDPGNLRVSYRYGLDPRYRDSYLGFRVVAAPGRSNP